MNRPSFGSFFCFLCVTSLPLVVDPVSITTSVLRHGKRSADQVVARCGVAAGFSEFPAVVFLFGQLLLDSFGFLLGFQDTSLVSLRPGYFAGSRPASFCLAYLVARFNRCSMREFVGLCPSEHMAVAHRRGVSMVNFWSSLLVCAWGLAASAAGLPRCVGHCLHSHPALVTPPA